jgi:hypothetical protein
MQRVISGHGPTSPNRAGSQKQYSAYIEPRSIFLEGSLPGIAKTGKYSDDSGSAQDTVVPEFLDRFASPMPILYLRARTGAPQVLPSATGYGKDLNGVMTDNNLAGPTPPVRAGQYDISQILAYTGPDASGHYIGVGKSIKGGEYKPNSTGNPPGPIGSHGLRTVNTNKVMEKSDTANYQYPYDAFPYFTNPAIPNSARQKDSYILISAGPDRVYGTSDDIANFGSVLP